MTVCDGSGGAGHTITLQRKGAMSRPRNPYYETAVSSMIGTIVPRGSWSMYTSGRLMCQPAFVRSLCLEVMIGAPGWHVRDLPVSKVETFI